MPSYAVTGASRGIGFEFVKQLSDDSNNTVLAIVRNKTTSTKVTELGRPNVHLLQADILDYTALQAVAEEAKQITGGSLDVLINNAALVGGNHTHWKLDEYSGDNAKFLEADMLDSFKTNVLGVIHTTNAFLPLLKQGELKKVITLSTGISDLDFTLLSQMATGGPYCSSKAALNLVVAKYAVQFKADGFVFLALCPGLVSTSRAPSTPEQIKAYQAIITQFKKIKPEFERALTPEESVKAQLKVINSVTAKDTGAFLSHNGNKDWL